MPPTCEYSATPAGSGNNLNATTTFVDPFAVVVPPASPPPPHPPSAPFEPAAPPAPSTPIAEVVPRCHYPVGHFGGGASSETDEYMHSTASFADELGAFPGKCFLSAMVLNTDYNNDDEYVVQTTVNGIKVHGECYPRNDAHLRGAEADGLFFPCFTLVPLPAAPDNKYEVVMTATAAVDESFGNPLALETWHPNAHPEYADDALFVEYIVSCERDECSTPMAPPPPPPSPTTPPQAPPPPPPMCAHALLGQGSGASSTVGLTFQTSQVQARDTASCYLTVQVKNTDYDQADEYIMSTTANGVEVHGKCSPMDGAVVDDDGYFLCAERVALPFAIDGVYEIETRATEEVEEVFEGNHVVVDYTVHCVSDKCAQLEAATCTYTAEETAAPASPLTIFTGPHTTDGLCYLRVELRTDNYP